MSPLTKKRYIHWRKDTYTVADAAQPVLSLLSTMKRNRTTWVILLVPDRKMFFVFTRSELEKHLKNKKSNIAVQSALDLREDDRSLVFSEKDKPKRLQQEVAKSGPARRTLLIDRGGRIRAVGRLLDRPYGSGGGGSSKGGGSVTAYRMKRAADAFWDHGKRKYFWRPERRSHSWHAKRRSSRAKRRSYSWQTEGESRATAPSYKEYHVVRIYYATDRALKRKTEDGNCFYANERCADGRIVLGTCDVSVPHDHKMGQIDSPSIWRLQFRANPKKHIIVLNTVQQSRRAFFNEMRERVAQHSQRSAFVFIHGYNVSFGDAAKRTAHLAYDLKFPGAPILYSWPSRAAILAYLADGETIQLTKSPLVQFLMDVAKESGARVVHLIAHSMGNRALARALEDIVNTIDRRQRPKFRQIVLTAPDINREEFLQLAAKVRRLGRRVTLYASRKDVPLYFSKRLNEYDRAGYAGQNMVVLPYVDTVDASSVKTDFVADSSFGDSDTVLSDLFFPIWNRQPPDERPRLLKKVHPSGFYWEFR